MRLTSKSRYAITAMITLALNHNKGPMTLFEISESQGISLSYLEQLFASLRAKGLVKGFRGPGGGYALAKSAELISIAEIICATDEWVDYTYANERDTVQRETQLSSRTLWSSLSKQLYDFVSDIKLSDLINRQTVHASHEQQNKIAA
ncbi:MAG: Rrf2 family transcriptional regulator [Candidatus Thiodiazotropha taylori]|nr:Rrf2 family transcriptional regulator [Candidatus Thiodiazotropha taylori]MCG7961601.1 Rrf2 family transcriptional regulator [Candidatus Thiodiazotropha endolucinida]MCG7966474.1 Rrf2 family transcriptional regulator [Candidatus Thiodiazotropha taylori]MCG8043991.1 Rrf2 family transcriptional regulator [Candidatus Thiodiazotropha taylori]MCG8051183.1 Rrf2 family transcriptional regulator [Candidatus Thiodiazotropha taylori]